MLSNPTAGQRVQCWYKHRAMPLHGKIGTIKPPEPSMPDRPTDLFGARPAHFAGAGYLASPGTGPAGETCGTCAHCQPSGGWYKCALVQQTPGKGTDISRRAPACLAWQDSSEA